MKLYLLTQSYNGEFGTCDAIVVAANSEEEARVMTPRANAGNTWASPKYVSVEYIGEAVQGTESGVILASFNAG